MRYYLQPPEESQRQAFDLQGLKTECRAGRITPTTPIFTEDAIESRPWSEFQSQAQQAASPPAPSSKLDRFRTFLWPFNELHRLGDINNRSLLALTSIGLVPMALFTLMSGLFESTFVYFLTALYFSVLWAILFYHVFPAPNIRIGTSILCFLGTGLVSISLLVAFFKLPFISLPAAWINAELPALRAFAFIFWVAFPEELCKILMIYVLSKRSQHYLPRTMAYYGMISGLGFGIHEGLDYQLDRNVSFAESQAEYLFLNLLRLTSLPVLHAVWTGIAAYFLGFAYLYRHRQFVLTVVALAVPTILHALFNTFNGTLTSLGISLLSLLMLILYLSKHDAFDIFLGRDLHLRSKAASR